LFPALRESDSEGERDREADRQRQKERGERACSMEYYAPAKGAPSSFAGLESSGSESTGLAVLGSIQYDDWRGKHGAPSPGSTTADTGPDGKLLDHFFLPSFLRP